MHDKEILIIGGGAAGMACALEAAERGFSVFILEKTEDIGGQAVKLCCKATDRCNKCSACLVLQHRIKVELHPLITIFCRAEILEVAGRSGAYSVKISSDLGERELRVGAVVIASGFKPFDPAVRGEFHYGKSSRVITALELENLLQRKGSLSEVITGLKNIGFVQCVGSRDLVVGNSYCSKVCCMSSMKLAKLIRAELPQAEVTVFYMDLQTFGNGFGEFMGSVKDEGIKFVRGIPAKVYSFPYDKLTVRYADSLLGEAIEDKFDLIILATAMTGGEDTFIIASLFNIAVNKYGFFGTLPESPIMTCTPGVFLAGACQSPKDILQSVEQGKAAAGMAVGYITQNQ